MKGRGAFGFWWGLFFVFIWLRLLGRVVRGYVSFTFCFESCVFLRFGYVFKNS